MPETDPSPQTKRAGTIAGIIGFVVAGAAVIVLLHQCHHDDGPVSGNAAAHLAGTAPPAAASRRGAQRAEMFDQQVETSRVPGALAFRALKVQFPDDYAAYLTFFAARTGAGIPPAQFKAETQNWLGNFIGSHRSDLVRAPDPLLIAIVHAQTAALLVLRAASPELCQHYATTGLLPGDTPPADALMPLTVVQAAKINAIGAGRRNPARPEPTAMEPADAEALAAGMMRLGATADDIDHLKVSLLGLPSERQCAITIRMLQAIAALPQEQAGRLASVIYQDPAKVK